ncbi:MULTISPECIES: sulfurtransferase TusA family protein [unclassified Chelatococcus]|uniref:sulfurtransferase TusA family protein n=1 Tax=unclassified Chelatococcus TaxID=2638111 RepID=UPI001BCE2A3F|nr:MULTISPECIES: sulfurtransferase TusA family protein [unclassified Chelatococcus]MBS7698721.1 sulfurtransferase TusA family protein [Chelatococcus sp. YT9]MBX3554697.1 sulfurtransferase TusA family protein [Chelatococcus sp.]
MAINLDLRGLKCPLPVLHTRKALQRAAVGTELVITCTDPMAAIDIPHLLQQRGDRLVSQQRNGDTLIFTVERRSP